MSVIVPVLNAGDTIGPCIDSLLSQDFSHARYSIVAVDNGSVDRTKGVLRGYGDRIMLLEQPVPGPAAARNLGILSTDHEIVAFIDADCVARPDWLGNLLSGFEDASIGMVGGRILSTPRANAIQLYGERIHNHAAAIESARPPYVISMNSAIRRRVLAEAGLFDVGFRRGEDVDLSWRVGRLGHRFRYVADAVISHRNESTFSGLLSEGALHGYYGLRIKRHHHAYLEDQGRKRNRFGHLKRAVGGVRRYLGDSTDRGHDLCDAVFNLGKSVGSLAGSLRYGYFEM